LQVADAARQPVDARAAVVVPLGFSERIMLQPATRKALRAHHRHLWGALRCTVRFTASGVTSLRYDFIEVFPLPANQLFE
jgi:hypothetical protein